MLILHSFLRPVLCYFRTFVLQAFKITKKLYRSAAVMTTGLMVITVIAFSSNGFGGGGKNALAAYAQVELEPEADEGALSNAVGVDLITEAKIQAQLTNSINEGKLLVGNRMAREVLSKQETQAKAQEEVQKLQEEIRLQREAEERARAQEEARRRAEEEQRRARQIPYSEQDYQVMLRIVQAEAGICDDRGRILVANVIMNRVRNSHFPGSITEVVYQGSQFSPVMNGSINKVKVSPKTIECVNRALDGEDYSQGALYFMNRKASVSRAVNWFDSHLTYLFAHGGHEFYK